MWSSVDIHQGAFVHHSVVLIDKLDEPELLHAMVEAGDLRASGQALSGDFEGIAFISSRSPDTRTVTMKACPEGALCDGLPILPILGFTSNLMPDEVIVYAALSIHAGQVRTVAKKLKDLPDPPGDVLNAAVYVFGREDVQILVEVVGRQQADVLQRVLEMTDLEGVTRVRTVYTTEKLTRGHGSGIVHAE